MACALKISAVEYYHVPREISIIEDQPPEQNIGITGQFQLLFLIMQLTINICILSSGLLVSHTMLRLIVCYSLKNIKH